eukprot:scaffold51459_cov62-Phaeocystis_antarctica.AAC.7
MFQPTVERRLQLRSSCGMYLVRVTASLTYEIEGEGAIEPSAALRPQRDGRGDGGGGGGDEDQGGLARGGEALPTPLVAAYLHHVDRGEGDGVQGEEDVVGLDGAGLVVVRGRVLGLDLGHPSERAVERRVARETQEIERDVVEREALDRLARPVEDGLRPEGEAPAREVGPADAPLAGEDAEQHREAGDEDRNAHPHLHTSPAPPEAAGRVGGRVERGSAVGINAGLLPAEAAGATVSTAFPDLFGIPCRWVSRRAGV